MKPAGSPPAADGGGLYLLDLANGSGTGVIAMQVRRNFFSGVYPDVTLAGKRQTTELNIILLQATVVKQAERGKESRLITALNFWRLNGM
ncbi:hypothetical protein KCP75_01450 [Salmonella enterica subsp. enterica]|nr:hypothetical protein KCP75_01450 [Salmonella enterica subsp. enterica]